MFAMIKWIFLMSLLIAFYVFVFKAIRYVWHEINKRNNK